MLRLGQAYDKYMCDLKSQTLNAHDKLIGALSFGDDPGSASTGNQLYRQRKQRQPVTHAAQAQATSYPGSTSTGHQLPRQRKHRQQVTQAAQTQANRYSIFDTASDFQR